MPLEHARKRLKNIREELNLKQWEFAEQLGMNQGPYSAVEREEVGISFKLIQKLITTFKINPNYIYLGHLPMFLDDELSPVFSPQDKEQLESLKKKIETQKTELGQLYLLLEEKSEHLKSKANQIELLQKVVDMLEKK